MIQWHIKPLSELNNTEMNLINYKQQKAINNKNYHLWATLNNQLVAAVRIYELEGFLTFDQLQYTRLINLETLIYRILEVGSRFFDLQLLRVAPPTNFQIQTVYDQIGLVKVCRFWQMRYYH